MLNALAVDPQQNWKGPWRWYEEQMLNCCLDLEDVKATGITLKDFRCLAHCQGLSIDLHYCDDSTLDDFRSAVQRACMSDEQQGYDSDGTAAAQHDEPLGEVLVISYSRKILGQTGSGHFSPVAAYDPSSDSVLILDTARFKYGAHWAKLPLVYDAMKPMDPDTGKSRGYSVLSFHPVHKTNTKTKTTTLNLAETESVVQPMSLLFRSKLTQNFARRKYKEYLQSLESDITWEQACTYWLNDNINKINNTNNVWNILEPLRLPQEEEDGARTVENIRCFLRELLHSLDPSGPSCCDGLAKTGKCMGEKDALYVIYLASISETQRIELVNHFPSKASTSAREQLLNEANLIATAIFYSEESSF